MEDTYSIGFDGRLRRWVASAEVSLVVVRGKLSIDEGEDGHLMTGDAMLTGHPRLITSAPPNPVGALTVRAANRQCTRRVGRAVR